MAIPSIHPDRLIELFTRFVTIDGVSLAERNIADAATGVLVSAGIHVQEDSSGTNRGGNAGNLWCFPPGFDRNQPALMLTAHLDTVLPTANLKPIVGQGKITSDGTTILGADNRAGLSVLTNLLLTVSDGKIPTRNFFVVFTIAEEIGLLGADGLDLTGYDV
jgi:tripeptide aminopeptidase